MTIRTLLNAVRKTTGSTNLAESKYFDIPEYISTGSYAINRLVSGSIYKGLPSNRVTIAAGESATGKSLLAAQVVINALKINKYDIIFYFDSEGGALKEFITKSGVDITKIEPIPLLSVEDATVKILSVYEAIKEEKKTNPDFKAYCILDSLGALVTNKLYADADKGKQTGDMGLRSKMITSLMKGIAMPALETGVGMLILNHIFDNPGALFPSKIKTQGGGHSLKYIGHVLLQCTRTLEKAEGKEEKADAFYKGAYLNFCTVKNRIVKPFAEATQYIDFSRGIVNQYAALIDSAIKYGFIEPVGHYFIVPSYSEKKIKRKDLETRSEIWDTFIADYDLKSIDDLSYSSSVGLEDEEDNDNSETEVDESAE